jgi:hypothetical protein
MKNTSNPPPGKSEYPNRYGYILHLWNSPGDWRASLENLETGRRFGFESLEQLFTYLMDLTESNLPAQQSKENEPTDESQTGIRSCGCSSADSIKTQ